MIEKQLNTHSIWESKFWLDIYFYFRDKILTNGSLPIMLLIGGIVLFCLGKADYSLFLLQSINAFDPFESVDYNCLDAVQN